MCHLGGGSMEGSAVTRLKGGAPGGPPWPPCPTGVRCGGGLSPRGCGGGSGVPRGQWSPAVPPWSRRSRVEQGGSGGQGLLGVAPAGGQGGAGQCHGCSPCPIPNKEPMQTQGSGVAARTRGHPRDVDATTGAQCSLVPGDPPGHHVAFIPHEDEGTWDTIPGWCHQAMCHYQCHHRQREMMRATRSWDMNSHHPEPPPEVGPLWVMMVTSWGTTRTGWDTKRMARDVTESALGHHGDNKGHGRDTRRRCGDRGHMSHALTHSKVSTWQQLGTRGWLGYRGTPGDTARALWGVVGM